MAQYTGKVWVLGDDIDTDIIIPTEYCAIVVSSYFLDIILCSD